jgi:hypothetical protein
VNIVYFDFLEVLPKVATGQKVGLEIIKEVGLEIIKSNEGLGYVNIVYFEFLAKFCQRSIWGKR